jgi:hypothetical protein
MTSFETARPSRARRDSSLAGLSLAFATVLLWSGPAFALCGGPLENNNFRRPIDINSAEDRDKIFLVERAHFTPSVEALIKGSTSKLPGDIHYTLRHIPNHYRALSSMATFQLRNPTQSDRYWTMDCYFERAFTFRPKDAQLHMLYGTYLHKAGRNAEARRSYAEAEALGLISSELYYNRGLLEFELNDLEVARRYASLAYAHGYPLPALRDKLRAKGYTLDESPATAE